MQEMFWVDQCNTATVIKIILLLTAVHGYPEIKRQLLLIIIIIIKLNL